jgi:orotate phosphoribosyltransferase
MSYHASYLETIFDRKRQDLAIRKMRKLIKDVEFDGFIVTGVSGIAMGAIMARSCRKTLTIVRKDDDKNTHSGYDIENVKWGAKYIFLDDLIASGVTFKKVKKKFRNYYLEWKAIGCKESKIIGQLLYDWNPTYKSL